MLTIIASTHNAIVEKNLTVVTKYFISYKNMLYLNIMQKMSDLRKIWFAPVGPFLEKTAWSTLSPEGDPEKSVQTFYIFAEYFLVC